MSRRRGGRTRAAAAAAWAMVVVLTAAPMLDRGAAAQDTGRTTPQMVLREQTSWVEPDGDFVLRVDVADAPPGATLDVTLHDRLTGRIQFAEGLEGEPGGPVISRRCGTLLDGAVAALDPCRVPLDDADRDAEDGGITIVIPVRSGAGPADRVRLGADGVYPVRLALVDDDGNEQATLVTHLVRAPDAGDDSPPLGVSVLLPLAAPLATQPDGTVVLDPAAANELSQRFAALAEHPDVPLVLVPRPESLPALAAHDPGAIPPALDAVEQSQVLATPYVDVDVGSWWNAGLAIELADLMVTGADTDRDVLGVEPDASTWVVGPTTDRPTLTRLADDGVEQLVVPDELLGELDEGAFPIALDRPFEIDAGDGTRLPAVLDDDALRGHIGATGDPMLDAQHLLADLALLYSQQPGIPRGVAFSLPTESVDPTFLDTLLTGLATSPMVAPMTVDDLLASAEIAHADGADARDGAPLVRPLLTVSPPDLGSYPERRAETETTLDTYRALAVDDDAALTADELVRVSGSLELDDKGQQEYLDGAVAQLAGLASGIVLPSQGQVTLTARQGRIPIVLHNEQGQAVEVLVRLESPKLEFPEGDDQLVALEPGETRLAWLVRTRASGAFPVEVSVWTPDGSLRLDTTRFTMRSTAVPGIGIALSALAAMFLAVWWARHWRSTRRAARLVDSPADGDPTLDHDRVIDEITRV